MANAYEQAGVNIEAGYETVNKIQKHAARTKRLGVLSNLGSFGGMFDLSALQLKEPVLVSGTDGVGTKLKLAFLLDKHDTIGVDAVAMCVNDIVVQGAEPLFFLDYIACGKLDPNKTEQIVKGIADGCEQAGCALIGGETAEMPGLYDIEEYDLAGFSVGGVEKSEVITGENLAAGDVLIGIASSGIHSNGYSLVRKIFLEEHPLPLEETAEGLTTSLGDALMTPTKIYVKQILALRKALAIKGMAHITGGGFIENVPRMLPNGLTAVIKEGTWPILPIFKLLETYGKIPHHEMFNIFNMGIGFVVAVDKADANMAVTLLQDMGESAFVIGEVVHGDEIVIQNKG